MPLPRIVFDTSAVNTLAKDGALAEPQIAALKSGFDVLLTAMSVDEMIAAPVALTRETLFARCQRLLVSGRCVWPPHEIIARLVLAHANDPRRFNWRKVPVRARDYERAIVDRDFPEELCAEQRRAQLQVEQEYTEYWERLRPKLAPILDRDPGSRPKSYRQAVEIARSAKPNLIAGIGKGLYSHATGINLADAEIEIFLEACPPVRAACYGLCGSWYDVSLAPAVFKKLAGRNDQMMAAYLPYCDQFVTEDKKQLERLHEISVEAKLGCVVSSYSAFWTGFMVGA
jgi:hypothetical protein